MTSPLPMTAGRWVALVIGTPLALLAIGWTALTAVAWAGLGSYRVNLAVPVHGRTATVSMDTGDISVRQGPAGQLRVHGIARYSLVRPQVSWRRSASGIALHSRCRVPTGLCSVNFAVTLPAGGRSEVHDASGDLTASGLAGTITLNDASGDLTASGLAGTITINAASGDISATRISGGATISDDSGDIAVTSLSAARTLIMNDSGNITGTDVSSQDLTAQDHSGDITVVFTKVPRRVRVSNESGNITLVLPPGPTAYRVSASTSSGQPTIAVPESPSSPYVITATDQSGDITIAR